MDARIQSDRLGRVTPHVTFVFRMICMGSGRGSVFGFLKSFSLSFSVDWGSAPRVAAVRRAHVLRKLPFLFSLNKTNLG